jgi:toxin-antitoxin system PIN domain toxin
LKLFDVNVLIYTFREDADQHGAMAELLQQSLDSTEGVALSDFVLSSVVRIATLPFGAAANTSEALDFVDSLRRAPGVRLVSPGSGHWRLFRGLCSVDGVRGNLIPDAYIAALAIEHDLELVSTDRDFARFPGLRSPILSQPERPAATFA